MPVHDHSWQQLGDAGPAESRALEALRRMLPDDPRTRAWCNVTLRTRAGRAFEVDVILIHRHGDPAEAEADGGRYRRRDGWRDVGDGPAHDWPVAAVPGRRRPAHHASPGVVTESSRPLGRHRQHDSRELIASAIQTPSPKRFRTSVRRERFERPHGRFGMKPTASRQTVPQSKESMPLEGMPTVTSWQMAAAWAAVTRSSP